MSKKDVQMYLDKMGKDNKDDKPNNPFGMLKGLKFEK